MSYTELTYVNPENQDEIMVGVDDDGTILSIYVYNDGIPNLYSESGNYLTIKWTPESRNPLFLNCPEKDLKRVFAAMMLDPTNIEHDFSIDQAYNLIDQFYNEDYDVAMFVCSEDEDPEFIQPKF